ncbi:MAG TPA: hypothetical protein VFC19_39795, partial [Candidatus Limnocylindrales bacterium]|nr:hypothetical protein [Candidatus Limnocylindrales bacterium]
MRVAEVQYAVSTSVREGGGVDRGELVNDAERRLWDAFTRGESVDLGAGDPTAEDFDPEQWGPSRTVRAEVIMGLLLGVRDEERGRIAKVVLVGARIDGTLDLNGGATPYELSLERCWLEQTPDFGETSTKSLVAIACRFPGLVAHGWQSAGPALLADARFTGEIDLTGARVGGVLDLSGATLTNPDGHALNAQNLTVEQDILCCDGFTATGAIDLNGAKVGGQLDMSGATLINPDGDALNGQNLTVEQDMFCGDGFTATGGVGLAGAKVGGTLSMSGATLINPDGDALSAYDLTVEQGMFCRDRFTAAGAINLSGAKVGGQLDMSGATLTNPDGDALNGQNLTVEQDMFCGDGFTATGGVGLAGAKVGGTLS